MKKIISIILIALLLPINSIYSINSINSTFNSGDPLRLILESTTEPTVSIATTSDGKIVGLISDESNNYRIMLYRLNTDGSLDATFGSGGYATFKLAGENTKGRKLKILSDGSIIVVGGIFNGVLGYDDAYIAKFTANGSLDASFGTGGFAQFSSSYNMAFHDFVVDQFDFITAVGYDNMVGDMHLGRVDANGASDTNFGSSGFATLATFYGQPNIYSINIRTDNTFLVAGRVSNSGTETAYLACIGITGNYVTTFGTNGEAYYDYGYDGAVIYSARLNSSDEIYAVGYTAVGSITEPTIFKFDASGSPVSSYGGVSTGANRTVFAQSVTDHQDTFWDMYLESDDSVIATGKALDSSDNDNGLIAKFDLNGIVESGSTYLIPDNATDVYTFKTMTKTGTIYYFAGYDFSFSNGNSIIYSRTSDTGGSSTSDPDEEEEEDLSDLPEIPNEGDGNGDGIPDSLQSNVSTFLSIDNTKYITVASDCGDLSEVRAANPKASDRAAFSYPYGGVEFKVNCSEALVKVYLHGLESADGLNYRKIKSDNTWFNFRNMFYSTEIIGGKQVIVANLRLTDGGPEDYDGIVNGVIYDPGGPAISIGSQIPTFSEWVRIISLGLFFLVGIWWVRRI